MASISAVIVPAKALKGGRHKIRISVSHNGETRYIVSDITLDSEKEFRNGSVVRRPDAALLNTKLRGMLQHYQEAMYGIDYIEGLKCPELVELLKTAKSTKNLTLESVFREYIETSRAANSTITSYETIWSTITKCLNRSMPVANVTYSTVLNLEKFLRKRKLSNSTIWRYMCVFSTVLNFAKKCGYVTYKVDPFASYRYCQPEIREVWLTVEEVKRIRDAECPKKNMCLCRDLFMLSYYLGGINITDLLDVDFDDAKAYLKYERKKTKNLAKANKFVEFAIPEEAMEIIARLKGKDGRIKVSKSQTQTKLNGFFSYNMAKLAELTHIDRVIYYSARKSFSQHAYELGVGQSVIDYILGHKLDRSGTMLFNYVYVTPEMATEAIRKVLDNLK